MKNHQTHLQKTGNENIAGNEQLLERNVQVSTYKLERNFIKGSEYLYDTLFWRILKVLLVSYCLPNRSITHP